MRRRLALGATLTLTVAMAACGNEPGGAGGPSSRGPASPSPGPSAAGGGELLFAVLEPGGDLTMMRDTSVAIVRLDGTARTKAAFTPRQLPRIGNASVLTQPEARVGGGRVFYADAAGAIRSLAPDGTVANAASFPLTSPQQLLSFAVSPDGARLVGTVFGFPPVHVPPPQTPVDPPFGPGSYVQQVFAAGTGGTATSLAKRTWAQSAGPPRDALAIVGWSDSAPLVTVDTALGTNAGSSGRRMFGHVAELDAQGRPGPPIGGYNCDAWSVLADETVLCDEDGQLRNFTVRARDGTIRFRLQAAGDVEYLDLVLAPDGSRVAYMVNDGRAMVSGRDGRDVALPSTFQPQGWLNANTVIGTVQTPVDGEMAVVRLDRPSRLDDLGFRGFFVGVVQGA